MIHIEHVFKKINGQEILNDINLSIARGEIIVILGGSGAGKSVLLQHMIGLMIPTSGKIAIDGKDVTKFSELQWLNLRKDMGYLFQDGALYDFMTVAENVAFPLFEHSQLKKDQIKLKVDHLLSEVGLSSAGNKYPSELSGGMRKRAALARSVILDSKILFCDEPTSGLDPILSKDIMDLIVAISRKLNCTTVITSHDIPNSLRIADRLTLVHQGKLVKVGSQKEFLSSTDPLIREFLK